jgi:hypothetical protein
MITVSPADSGDIESIWKSIADCPGRAVIADGSCIELDELESSMVVDPSSSIPSSVRLQIALPPAASPSGPQRSELIEMPDRAEEPVIVKIDALVVPFSPTERTSQPEPAEAAVAVKVVVAEPEGTVTLTGTASAALLVETATVV